MSIIWTSEFLLSLTISALETINARIKPQMETTHDIVCEGRYTRSHFSLIEIFDGHPLANQSRSWIVVFIRKDNISIAFSVHILQERHFPLTGVLVSLVKLIHSPSCTNRYFLNFRSVSFAIFR